MGDGLSVPFIVSWISTILGIAAPWRGEFYPVTAAYSFRRQKVHFSGSSTTPFFGENQSLSATAVVLTQFVHVPFEGVITLRLRPSKVMTLSGNK